MRLSDQWLDTLVKFYVFGYSAQYVCRPYQARDSKSAGERPPSTKTINKFYWSLGNYIYARTVLPLLDDSFRPRTRESLNFSQDHEVTARLMLERILSDDVPDIFREVTWRGRGLDISEPLAKQLREIYPYRRKAYLNAQAIVGMATLRALINQEIATPGSPYPRYDEWAVLEKNIFEKIFEWLDSTPLDIGAQTNEGSSKDRVRLSSIRSRPRINPLIEKTRISESLTDFLLFHFLQGWSGQETFDTFSEHLKAPQFHPIPSVKTINKIYRRLGRYIFAKLYAPGLEMAGKVPREAGGMRERALEEEARQMLNNALSELPYEHYRILHPSGEVSDLHPDMNMEVRKLYARRKGLADDPRTVIALARMRSEYSGFTTSGLEGPAPASGKAAEDDLWAIHITVKIWLSSDPLTLS